MRVKNNPIKSFIKKARHYKPSKRSVLIILTFIFLLGLVGMFVPISHTEYRYEQVFPEVVTQPDSSLELGESKIDHEGVEGEKVITLELKRSLFDLIFRKDSIRRVEVSSKVTKKPIEKTVLEGTRKFQYMYCSDGSYRYYSDEQFKSASIGFTSKSEDGCTQNGHGKKIGLGDTPTPNTSNTTSSPRTSGSDYSYSLGEFPTLQQYDTTIDSTVPEIKPTPKPPTNGAGMTYQQVYDYCRQRLLSGAISGQSGFTSCMYQGGF